MDAVTLQRFEDSPHILDLLVQVEDVLDAMDAYVFKNWIDGEIVEGPIIRRHWIGISLLFPENRMPDPRFAYRLMKHGVKVSFKKVERASEEDDERAARDEADPMQPTQPREEDAVEDEGEGREKHWMVRLDFPRRFVGQINAAALDAYDDDVDTDDVQAAQDSGLNDESAFKAPAGSEPNPELAANAEDPDAEDENARLA